MVRVWSAVVVAVSVLAHAGTEEEGMAEIVVDTTTPGAPISPLIFGHFTEMTLTSFEGSASSEWLFNRKFGIDETEETEKLVALRSGTGAGWTPIGYDTAITLLLDRTTFISGPFSQRITLLDDAAGPAGIFQTGFQPALKQLTPLKRVPYPFRFEAGTRYRVRIALRHAGEPADVHVGLGADVTSMSAETVIAPTESWAVVERTLVPESTVEDGRFFVFIREPGTVWVDSVSLIEEDKDVDGFRRDVIAVTDPLTVTNLRWPGGCFADDYDWRAGIGPLDRRAVTYNRAWKSFTPNDVGTDEFIQLCRLLEAEPYLCVNYGTGTPEEAAAWVEYCNGPADSEWGRVRAAHGYPEPYGVRYWNIGNEIYLPNEFGATSGSDYGRGFVRFAEAMRAVDPEIQLVAVGCFDLGEETMAAAKTDPIRWQLLRYFNDWTQGLLAEAGEHVDMISIHFYDPGGVEKAESVEQVNALCMGVSPVFEERLDRLQEIVAQCAPVGKAIPIALDEWATWAQDAPHEEALPNVGGDKATFGLLGSRENLRSALGEATIVNVMQRRPEEFGLANKTLLYAYATGEVAVRRDAVMVSPCGLMMQLYATRSVTRSLHVQARSNTFTIKPLDSVEPVREVPYLDASARVDDAGCVELFVVNRSLESAIRCRLEFNGLTGASADVAALVADSVLAWNSFDEPHNVQIIESTVVLGSDGALEHEFPRHSLTRFRIGPRSAR